MQASLCWGPNNGLWDLFRTPSLALTFLSKYEQACVRLAQGLPDWIYVCFVSKTKKNCITPSGAPVLHLTLSARIIYGSAWGRGDHMDARDQSHVGHVQGKQTLCPLYYGFSS